MHRHDFLKSGVQAAVVGTAVSAASGPPAASGGTVVEVATRQEFVPASDPAAPPAASWQLPPRSL